MSCLYQIVVLLGCGLVLQIVGLNNSVLQQTTQRKLLARADESITQASSQQSVKKCASTKSGRTIVTDDQGIVCSPWDIDIQTGCCTSGNKHVCEGCKLGDQCCDVYEHCVSCCLGPNFTAEELYKVQYRVINREQTGYWSNAFELCAGRCRTTYSSTSHENSYIDKRHYCFSEKGRPQVDEPPLPPLPPEARIFQSEASTSCDNTCASKHMQCAPELFHAINSCNFMRDTFQCEASCLPNDIRGAPMYIKDSAPKTDYPAQCWVRKDGWMTDENVNECDVSVQLAERLCVCMPRVEGNGQVTT